MSIVLEQDPGKIEEALEFVLPTLNARPSLFRSRSEMAPFENSDEATTLGWDTVFAIRLSDVNAALVRSGQYPRTFEKDLGSGWSINGQFGAWQMSRGGSGSIVFMQIPITAGTMAYSGDTYALQGATVYISVKLQYVPQIPTTGISVNDFMMGVRGADLEVDELKTNWMDRSEADPAVVVQNITFASTPPSPLIRALMTEAFRQWFTDNLVQFAYTFSTVCLNEHAAEEQFQWVKPTYTSYGYLDGATDDTSIFGVLCMTDSRSPLGLTNQLAPGAIPKDARAGFSISMERFLEKLVLPGLSRGFPDASASDFTMKSNNTIIENTQPIQTEAISYGGIPYYPWIQKFTLQVVGSEVQVHTVTKVEISPGIRAWVECTSYQEIIVVDKPDGTQTLNFKEARPADKNYWIEKDVGIIITEIIIGIIGVVVAGIAKLLITSVAKFIIALIIIAIVCGLAAAIPELIAKVAGGGAAEALPPIDLLILNSTSPIKWPGASGYTLTCAGLNGSFQLGGDPGFTH